MSETVDIEEAKEIIRTLEDAIGMAQARNDYDGANELYLHQQRVYRLLPGGDQPAVGEAGVTV